MPNRRSVLKSAITMLVTGAAVSTVSMSTIAVAKAPFQRLRNPGFYRMKVGEIEVTALSDGTLNIPLAKVHTNTTEQHAQAALNAAFQGGSSETSVNSYLINNGARLVLIDAGSGSYLGPTVGRLIENMVAAGYHPDQVDDVVLTHVHTDHSGGLIVDGKPAFANATVHVNKRETAFWLETAEDERPGNVPGALFTEAEECLAPYIEIGRFRAFDDNSEVLPGLLSILRAGHTSGHSSYVLENGGEKLVIWGDITHGDVLQFDEPDVAIEFDVDQKMAVKSRKIALSEAADQGYLVAAAHPSFPGFGHVRRDSTNYDWVPLSYKAN